MKEPLFSITCTTCQTRLAVRDEAAIGAILSCPKCGSMVQVSPPSGWGSSSESETISGPLQESSPQDSGNVASGAPTPPVPPPLPTQPVDTTDQSPVPLEAEAPVPSGLWSSPTELIWRKRLLAMVLAVGGMVIVAGLGITMFSGKSPQKPPDENHAGLSPEETLPVEPAPEPAPVLLGRRWVPDETTFFVRLHLPEPGGPTGLDALMDQTASLWQPALEPVLTTFGVRLGSLRLLQLAATDLNAPAEKCAVLIEFQPGHDAGVFDEMGEAYPLKVEGVPCRRMPGAPWSHPYVVLDEHTLVTAPEDLLRHLAERPEVRLASAPVDRLTESMRPESNFLLLIDLVAARRAAWRLPTALFDVWPPGRDAWRCLWETPFGAGVSLRLSEGSRSRLGLVCADEPAAEKVTRAMETLISEAKTSLVSFGKDPSAEADKESATNQFNGVIEATRATLDAARCDTTDSVAWLQLDWGPNPLPLGVAALESRPAIGAAWLAAARVADETTQRQLMDALADELRATGHFPDGILGGSLLNPETRLSWFATMLPYLGHDAWHERLDAGYAWNGTHNAPVTRQPLPEVVNPALGPSQTKAGFPVTHYVGVAGVGADAPRLPKDNPRAGVFGFNRTTSPDEIPDGASNTLAVLGVVEHLGAWASGGRPTVRPLTQAPYVNGPDGFGSGQPDGMTAGMADGSVRFLSKEIDPRVMEQLATTHGREHIDLASLNPKATLPPASSPPSSEPVATTEPEGKAAKPAEESSPADPADEALRQRLAEPLPRLESRGQPLSAVVMLLGTLGGFQVTLDEAILSKAGVSASEPVQIELTDTTVGEALEAVLAERGLRYTIRSGRVVVVAQ